MRISDWSIQRVLPLPYKRAHGVVRIDDILWVVHTADRLVVKLAVEDGQVLEEISVPDPHPEPHGLSIYGQNLIYCDAASGWVAQITL
jgi:hypothetical protein